jgi:hypothetical protein
MQTGVTAFASGNQSTVGVRVSQSPRLLDRLALVLDAPAWERPLFVSRCVPGASPGVRARLRSTEKHRDRLPRRHVVRFLKEVRQLGWIVKTSVIVSCRRGNGALAADAYPDANEVLGFTRLTPFPDRLLAGPDGRSDEYFRPAIFNIQPNPGGFHFCRHGTFLSDHVRR